VKHLTLALILLLPSIPFAKADACRDLYQLTDDTLAVGPGVAVPAEGAVPAHCRVRGVIGRGIRFEVRMPVRGWNRRFLFEGTGSFAGYLADTTRGLADGYAVSTTDTGHQGAGAYEFLLQPQAFLDYAFRGIHLATTVTNRVVSTYYGKSPASPTSKDAQMAVARH
jgi:hypothetical protein